MTQHPAARRLVLTIPPDWAGMRLSSVLRYKVGLSGTLLRRIKWLEDGILLDGARAHTNVRVQPGQTLDLLLSDPQEQENIVPTPGPLDIRYEDADILVVNKAPGLSVHPGPGHYADTLGNYLCWHLKQEGKPASLHPVHRLDKGTSGLIVTALHPFAQDQLRQQFHSNAFRRLYLAVCQGLLSEKEGVIDLPLGRCEDSVVKRRVRPDGDPAVTRYRVLAEQSSRSLLALELETGRTHQIRVHLAALGHPLTGDFLYGTESPLISRPALHSWRLSLLHPVTKVPLSWEVPLPEDMKALLE